MNFPIHIEKYKSIKTFLKLLVLCQLRGIFKAQSRFVLLGKDKSIGTRYNEIGIFWK
jgi:hypothetical protein